MLLRAQAIRVARNAKKSATLQKQRKALRTELEAALAHSADVGAPSLDQVLLVANVNASAIATAAAAAAARAIATASDRH